MRWVVLFMYGDFQVEVEGIHLIKEDAMNQLQRLYDAIDTRGEAAITFNREKMTLSYWRNGEHKVRVVVPVQYEE